MALYKFDFMFYVMLCYGDEIWCSMAFCAQVAGIGVGGGCDCILVRKVTVRQPDHSVRTSSLSNAIRVDITILLLIFSNRLPDCMTKKNK